MASSWLEWCGAIVPVFLITGNVIFDFVVRSILAIFPTLYLNYFTSCQAFEGEIVKLKKKGAENCAFS